MSAHTRRDQVCDDDRWWTLTQVGPTPSGAVTLRDGELLIGLVSEETQPNGPDALTLAIRDLDEDAFHPWDPGLRVTARRRRHTAYRAYSREEALALVGEILDALPYTTR